MLGNMIQKLFVFVVVSAILSRIPVSAQSNKIHISAPSKSLSWFPIHLTREKGFYRAEGLDVDYVIMKPQIAMQALIAGDVGYTTALGSTIRAALRNVPLRVVDHRR
jgi:ABC-type nitrate/sulfonate/bicarbonate transport system substrate-binding protein